MIGEFGGGGRDYDGWERQLRNLVNTYHLDELSVKALLCNRLKDRALRWYHSKSDVVEKNFYNILAEMRAMFDRRPSKLQRKREFEQRQWKPRESFAEYVHDKVTLGNSVPIANDEIVDHIIEGIPDENLQTQARIHRFRVPADIIEAFERVTLRPERTKANLSTGRGHERDDASKKRRSSPRPIENTPGCYNCNDVGHYAQDCTRPKTQRGTCYKCGKAGHTRERCNAEKE